MKILGLHFGHDATVAMIDQGKVEFVAHMERLTRRKKQHGLTYLQVVSVLDRYGISAEDIDYCTITSTQGIDIAIDRSSPLRIELRRHPADTIPSSLENMCQNRGSESIAEFLDPTQKKSLSHQRRKTKRNRSGINNLGVSSDLVELVPCLNTYFFYKDTSVVRRVSLKELDENYRIPPQGLSIHRNNFHFPVILSLDGRKIAASLINHHAAHAASTFYQSPFTESTVFTMDGGISGAEGGLFWFGQGNEIFPICMHGLHVGQVYLAISNYVLNLSPSGEGKMMGLASYGQPTFFDDKYVTNHFSIKGTLTRLWIDYIQSQARVQGYDMTYYGNAKHATAKINADLAASTQRLFEETVLEALKVNSSLLAKLNLQTPNIAMSGGCMLNCPANTRVANESAFSKVFVEPSCDDGGLAVGGALWLYYNVMRHKRIPIDPSDEGLPYYGLPILQEEIESALGEYMGSISVLTNLDIIKYAVHCLCKGRILGWFEGRSETGPRALGHRSIVADPRLKRIWHHVNTLKGRELWRPLAPSVLVEQAHDWFSNAPLLSPYMLFTGEVLRPEEIPAVTHFDKTARIQTVDRRAGGYYNLIKHFFGVTGCPVILNTSMNGPGEPIVERPEEAIKLLLSGCFDLLIFNSEFIVQRKN